jgi:hypothetical protein
LTVVVRGSAVNFAAANCCSGTTGYG